MSAHRYQGGCHCGNIALEIELAGELGEYTPRACDCDFCTRHGAAYVSDPRGRLAISIRDEANLSRYRQGNEIADMLVCRNCGVMVGATYAENGKIYATVNSKAVAGREGFAPEKPVSPKKLDARTKVERWKSLWFSGVDLRGPRAEGA